MSVVERELAGIKREAERLAVILEGAEGVFDGETVAAIIREIAEGATAEFVVDEYDIMGEDGV